MSWGGPGATLGTVIELIRRDHVGICDVNQNLECGLQRVGNRGSDQIGALELLKPKVGDRRRQGQRGQDRQTRPGTMVMYDWTGLPASGAPAPNPEQSQDTLECIDLGARAGCPRRNSRSGVPSPATYAVGRRALIAVRSDNEKFERYPPNCSRTSIGGITAIAELRIANGFAVTGKSPRVLYAHVRSVNEV